MLRKRGALPRTLNVQLDNITKQCKSRFMLGWLAFLVLVGVFDKVILSFLPVGHTHEDIDQFFSRVAMYLRGHDARSRQELMAAVRAAYKMKNGTRARTGHFENVANISHALEDLACLATMAKTGGRSGITKFHQFKFELSADKTNVNMQVKEWCSTSEAEDPWRGNCVLVFMCCYVLLQISMLLVCCRFGRV